MNSIELLWLNLESHIKMESRYGRLYVHNSSVRNLSQSQAQMFAQQFKANKIDFRELEKFKEYTIVKQILNCNS